MTISTTTNPAATGSDRFAHLDRRGAVAVLVMDRPEKLNAWTTSMRDEVAELLAAARDDDSVGAVVLTGTGRGFCAGQDFDESRGFDSAHIESWITGIKAFYDVVRDLDKPTVAAVNGVAAGSGFQVTLLMDVRIAHESATLGQPEVRSGIPSITGTYLISAAVGLSRATELVLSGRLMTAHEAHAAGAVHEVVTGDVVAAAVARAEKLAAQPSGAVASTKRWLRAMTEKDYLAAFEFARAQHRDAFASGAPQAMMTDFLGRR
jgi:enoyl-CoA hydratase